MSTIIYTLYGKQTKPYKNILKYFNKKYHNSKTMMLFEDTFKTRGDDLYTKDLSKLLPDIFIIGKILGSKSSEMCFTCLKTFPITYSHSTAEHSKKETDKFIEKYCVVKTFDETEYIRKIEQKIENDSDED